VSEGLRVGQRVGHYIVSSFLGAGGMGAVYVAEHPEIGRRVAIKVLSPGVSHVPGASERFLAEARAASRIDHPNVIDIYDFARTEDGALYYVMELLRGQDLARVIADRAPMPAAEALPYLRQICAGLQAAHDRGVVHRDLKPENIFVLDRQPLTIKLLDFGIAKFLEHESGGVSTVTGMIVGSPLTMAPEQAAGLKERIGTHTDLYALGVITYWMLAGRPPFADPTLAVLLVQHIEREPPSLQRLAPSIPPELCALVHRCLEKDPSRRPGSAEEVARTFAGALPAAQGEPAGGALPPTIRQHVAAIPPTRLDPGQATLPVAPRTLAALPPTELAVIPQTRLAPTRARRPWLVAPAVLGVAIVAGAGYLLLCAPRLVSTPSPSPDAVTRIAAPARVDAARGDRRVVALPAAESLDARAVAGDSGAPARTTWRVATGTPAKRPPRPAAPPSASALVILGRLESSGQLSSGTIYTGVRLHLDQLRYCYRQTLRSRPDSYGRVSVAFTIEPSGGVSGGRISGTTISDDLLERCFLEVIRRWRFPASSGRTVVVAPLVLRAGPSAG
jgi:hypothetical protein